MNNTKTRRVAELDGLRALAALVILLFHLSPMTFAPGWTGVDLFFVLSGYLITTIILDHLDARRFIAVFYARRSLRIWPIYYFTVAVLVLTAPLVPADRRPPLDGLGYHLTFTQNVTLYALKMPPKFHVGFDHSWTLALEEQYYILWPMLIALVAWSGWDRLGRFAGRRAVRRGMGRRMVVWRRNLAWVLAPGGRDLRLMALCMGVVSLAWMARAGGYLRLGPYSERILISRCDGFALGGLMAVILNVRPRVARHINRYRLAFGLVFLATFADIASHCYSSGMIGYLGLPTPPDLAGTHLMVNLFYFGLVGTVVTCAGHRLLAPLRWRPLCYLGLISYGIYLYHYPIYWVVDGYRAINEDSVWKGVGKMALTLVVAVASWHLVERPLLSFKDWFRYDANEAGAPVAPVTQIEPREEPVSAA